ncbi:winged helix-turn-helix domain-containing protein [Nostoc sp. NIES-2111]
MTPQEQELSIDFFRGQVERDGSKVELTAKELRLLHYLVAHRGRVVTRDELLDNVWGYQSRVTRTVDMHIAILRRKLGINALSTPRLLTLRGQGYLLV